MDLWWIKAGLWLQPSNPITLKKFYSLGVFVTAREWWIRVFSAREEGQKEGSVEGCVC